MYTGEEPDPALTSALEDLDDVVVAVALRILQRRAVPSILKARDDVFPRQELLHNVLVALRRRNVQSRPLVIVGRHGWRAAVEEEPQALELTLHCQIAHLA